MRLCFLSERLSPPFDEGFKNVAIHLIAEMGARHEVLALTCFGRNIAAPLVHNVAASRLLLSWPLFRAIRAFRPDLLYYLPTASATPFSFLRGRVLRAYARPGRVVLLLLQPRSNSRWRKQLIRQLAPDAVLLPSAGVAASLPPLPCPVLPMPLGVDLERFSPASAETKAALRRKYGLAEDAWVLLHVGHLKRERNVGLLARLQRKIEGQVVIVGSSSTRQEPDLTAELRAAGVKVISEYLDVVEAYRLADAYLFPVRNEMAAIGIPLSVLEAMACNLPVLTTPFGGLPELFPERKEDGFWYARNDEELVAEAKALRHFRGANTRALVAPYGWPQVAAQIVETTLPALQART